jgi:hypothetical protein
MVSRLHSFHRHPSLPVPPGLLFEFDLVWAYFGVPSFPLFNPLTGGQVDDVEGYLTVLENVFAGMEANLGQAATLFRDVPEPWYSDAGGFTLDANRGPQDPPVSAKWPNGVYFNPEYLNFK